MAFPAGVRGRNHLGVGEVMLRISKSQIERLERKQAAYLWGQKSFIRPVFIRQSLGDGNTLLAMTPLNTRPNHYFIRIDSKWLDNENTDVIYGHLDEIYDAIEEQCGGKDDEDDDGNHLLREWPALDLDCGCSWCDCTAEIVGKRKR